MILSLSLTAYLRALENKSQFDLPVKSNPNALITASIFED